MRQAIDCPRIPLRSARPGLIRQLLAGFFASPRPDRTIRPDTLSLHTLRDIGLAEDPRADHLLSDGWLRR